MGAVSTGSDTPGRRSHWYLCPVPKEYCIGRKSDKPRCKYHGAPEEVRSCEVRYWTTVMGYKKVGSREFQAPDSVDESGQVVPGSIQVLCKVSKILRTKGGKGDRPMPWPHDTTGRF